MRKERQVALWVIEAYPEAFAWDVHAAISQEKILMRRVFLFIVLVGEYGADYFCALLADAGHVGQLAL